MSTFDALESGLALRANLASFSALVIVAGETDWESALVAGDEEIAFGV